MSSKRRRVADRSGLSNTLSYYEEELEDIDLGHDPRTKLAEPDLSPITEESGPASASASSMLNQPWSPIVNDEQVASDSESDTDVQTSGAWKKTPPDTEYPALPRKASRHVLYIVSTNYLRKQITGCPKPPCW